MPQDRSVLNHNVLNSIFNQLGYDEIEIWNL